MVAAVGINRAITDECWAACTPGYVCDHESGLCVQGECLPRCSEDQVCARVDEQLTCVHKGQVYNRNLRGGGPIIPTGGPPDPHAHKPVPRHRPPTPAVPLPIGLDASSQSTSALEAKQVGKQARCPQPGSPAWYTERDALPTAPEPVEQSRADLVGLWERAPGAHSGEPPLLVTRDWLGTSKLTAVDYRVIESSASAVLIATSGNASARRDTIHFVTRDQIRFRGASYQRVDCTSSVMPAACCELPRERWVRLAPTL